MYQTLKKTYQKVNLLIYFLKYGRRVFVEPTSLADLDQLEFFQLRELNKYNIRRFDQRLYNRYQHWIELGRPQDFDAENEANNEIDNEQLNQEIEEENLGDPAPSSTFVENKDLANGYDICKKIGPEPPTIPGATCVFGWTLIGSSKEVVEKSFEGVM